MTSKRSTPQSPSRKTENDGHISPIVSTSIGGIGVPSGASKSPWGDTFLVRKKFFEKNAGQKDEDVAVEEDPPKLTRQYSSRRSLRRTTSSATQSTSSKVVLSPSAGGRHHSSSIPLSNSSNSIVSQSSAGVMSHETGQKESVADVHSQSDHDEEPPPLPPPETRNTGTNGVKHEQQVIRQDRDSELEKRKHGSTPVLRVASPRSTNVSPDVISTGLQTHYLDGRSVHISKENGDLSSEASSRQQNLSPASDSDKDLLERITSLMTEKNWLDAKLMRMTDEKQSLHEEVIAQQKTISSLQGLSNDLKKQKESLHIDNMRLSESLASNEKHRDTLVLREQEMIGNVDILEKNLSKMEGMYQTAEQQKQILNKEIQSVKESQDSLRKEKIELGQKLLEERTAKENAEDSLETVQKRISILEKDAVEMGKERDIAVKERDRNQKLAKDNQRKLAERDRKIAKTHKEMEELKELTETLQKEKASLISKLDQSQISSQQLKKQVEEVKWEKQQVEQRMATIKQAESDLRASLDHAAEEFSQETRKAFPHLNLQRSPSHTVGAGPLTTSPDALKEVTVIRSAVLGEVTALTGQRDELNEKVTQLKTQIETKQKSIDGLKIALRETKQELKLKHSEFQKNEKKVVDQYDFKLKASQEEIEALTTNALRLENTNCMLQGELDLMKQQSTEELDAVKSKLSAQHLLIQDYEKQLARMLVQRTVAVARVRLLSKVDVEEQPLTYDQLLLERDKLSKELDTLKKTHVSACSDLENKMEEIRNHKLETEKIKMLLSTEIELLKAQITQLEKDKNELKNKPSVPGSAFQQISSSTTTSIGANRKVKIDTTPDNSQKEIMELKHKLMLMEIDNKRLLDLTQTSSTMMDAGNVVRKHALEMRKRCIFLESEKKQLTEKVHTLHMSVKALRESKDRMISERLRALQAENLSLQDSIRTSETMFNKKLMCAASRIAETLKENDKLRCTLSHLHNGLSNIDTLLSSLTQLATSIQRQEQELATLRASLAGSGSNLTPAMEISERILKTHADLQIVLASRKVKDDSSSDTCPVSSASAGSTCRLTSGFDSSDTWTTSTDLVPPVGRARSHSHSLSPSVPTFVLQVREKVCQLYADNRSVFDLIKHGQDNLEARQNDVSRLREKLLSLLSSINVSVKVLQEGQENLLALNQHTLSVEQLTSIEFLEHEVENWQDKVFACEIALKDIETRMQEDYESHHQRFSQLMSQILDLKEENSGKRDKLIANDQYIHDIEERCLNAENELFKLRKEMESVLQEALKLPEGIVQLPSHSGHVTELIRSQNEDLMNLKVLLNSSAYHQSRLQAKVESIHRENTILKHQALENDRHHSKILEELYKERDYLRKMNSQLIERQLKTEEAGDILKKIKLSQEAEKEQRDFKKLSADLNNIKFVLREKDMTITELQHQLENHQLEQLKLQSMSANDSMIGPPSLPSKLVHPPRMRPLSANSVDLARQSRYRIIDHPKIVDRNLVESSGGAGHFMISIPGDNKQFNLESGSKSTEEGYILGFPVETDDEGTNFSNSTSAATNVPRKRGRHRRTASEGSDSLKSLMSSGSSASDSKPTKPFHCTLPRHQPQQKDVVTQQQQPLTVEPFSYSPINTPTPAETTQHDVVSHFAQKLSEQMEEMIDQHDQVIEDTKPTKLESSVPMKVDTKGSAEKGGNKSERFSKFRHFRPFGNKGNILDKDKGASAGGGKHDVNSKEDVVSGSTDSKSTPQLLLTRDDTTNDSNKSDETASSSNGGSNQVSRMESFASTMERSNSFVSNVSTTYSELGGESSPYSNYSLDSFSITDSIDNMLMLQERNFQRGGPFFTPIHQNYTSSSDDESRYANGNGNRTLKRTAASYYKDLPMPLFPPSSISHHQTTSSCDSDQLLANNSVKSAESRETIPVHRNESISISDMDKEFTDQEDFQQTIRRLEKKHDKVRRSSTGSITIWNHSGSSMEDIKNAGE